MENGQPNLVFVFPDQFRQQGLGCMSQDPVVTPNFDRFAVQSRVLTHAVSNRPVCSPYRAMLFTGKYPHANGVLTNCNSGTVQYDCYLRDTDRCLTDVLHDSGYSQGYIGKFHLDPPTDAHSQYTEGRRGEGLIWDTYTAPGPRRHNIDFWHSYGCCDNHLHPHYWEGDARLEERIDVDDWSVRHETDVTVDFIRNRNNRHRDADKPFALFVAHNPPHTPFEQVPPEYLEPYADATSADLLNRPNVRLESQGAVADKHVRNYFAAITGIDDQFGRILHSLEEEGLEDDTIVIFSADHGEMMGSQGLMHKGVWYDESLLIPFLIRWPGKIEPGKDDLLLSVPDIMPTLLNMMGCGDQPPTDLEGADLSGAFLGEETARPTSALYLDVHPENPAGGKRGLRTHRHTFVAIREGGEERCILHDNERDPYQLADIAPENPDLIADLRTEMNQWLEKTGDPWLQMRR